MQVKPNGHWTECACDACRDGTEQDLEALRTFDSPRIVKIVSRPSPPRPDRRIPIEQLGEVLGIEARMAALEAVALCAMRYSKHQSARYQRELLEAIDQLDRTPRKP